MSKQDLFEAQLFLDDNWVSESRFVQRHWHQPVKYPRPVLEAEHPWEQWSPVLYGSVLKRAELFEAWYCGWTRNPKPRVCYARSADGVVWEKPALGLYEWPDGRPNNIVLQSESEHGLIDDITVIEDPGDEAWPLKGLYFEGVFVHGDWIPGYGIYAARSKDGIHWDRLPGPVLTMWGDRFNALPARVDGKFVLFGRASGDDGDAYSLRRVWRTESEDLLHWSAPEVVLEPDAEDPASMQFYSLSAFAYGDLLLGGLERMHMTPDKLDTEVVWSRDGGRSWTRSRSRPRFIEWGPDGSWDSTWINLPASAPMRHENRLWFYYSGRSAAHGAPYPLNHGAMGLALLREDGFASIAARSREGYVLTPVLNCPSATQLAVHLDARSDLTSHHVNIDGHLKVEIRDAQNRPLAGYSRDDCTVIRKNTANGEPLVVQWQGKAGISELAGQPIRLAFFLSNCHLYSFRFLQ